jgi:hypothetical protein
MERDNRSTPNPIAIYGKYLNVSSILPLIPTPIRAKEAKNIKRRKNLNFCI